MRKFKFNTLFVGVLIFFVPVFTNSQSLMNLYAGAIPNARQGYLPDIAKPSAGMDGPNL